MRHRLGTRQALEPGGDRRRLDALAGDSELILTGSIKDVGVGIKRGRPGDGKAKAGTYTADFGTKN